MRCTAADLRRMSASAALAMLDRGFHPSDRVCISAHNAVEVVGLVDACLRLGIVPVVLSASATARELAEMGADVGARATFHDSDVMSLTNARESPESPESPEHVRCRPVHFTSGTSGRPKAVWSGWLDERMSQQWIADEQQAWGMNDSDVHLVCGPLNHSAPLRFALMTLWAGGTVIVPPKFEASTVAELLPSVTTTFMAPTHMQRLMDFTRSRPVHHSLRLLAHAGAACPDRVRLWSHETFGLDVVTEFYGSTEGQFTVCPATEWHTHPGSVGRSRPGRAMRVDEEGRLWSRAPEFARFEYWGDPIKTAEAWDGDWFTVGDYGRIDDDGYVYLDGRKGDLIITGGVNVYPAEVERVLSNMPGIESVIAFGLPDEDWGQRVCVAVVGSSSEEAIRAYARDELSGPKRPKSIYLVESLPLTHSGKIDRTAVPLLFR